jgi:alpha-galactosidase
LEGAVPAARPRKLVVVGAGSVEFTQGLVSDLIGADDLGPWELGLVDVDPDALTAAVGIARRMVEAQRHDYGCRVERTT